MKHDSLKTLTTAFCIFLLGISLNSRADDTDLYLNPQLPVASAPLVMFTLDYRANMGATQCNLASTPGTSAEIQAACGYSVNFSDTLVAMGLADDGRIDLSDTIIGVLKLVIDPLEGVKIGLMMPHENTTAGGGCQPGVATQCSNGAMVMMGFRELVAGDTNLNKTRFTDLLRSIPATDQVAGLPDYHPYQLKEMYFEFFRYLTGQDIYAGHLGWLDFDDSNAAKTTNLNGPEAVPAAIGAADPYYVGRNYPQWDATSPSTAATVIDPFPVPVETNNQQTYISPLIGINDCAKIFAINIGFGTANGDDDADTAIAAAQGAGGMGLTLSGANTQAQVVEFMNDIDLADGTLGTAPDLDGKQNVVSYFIMASANLTQDAWAVAGGTTEALELGIDPDALVELLTNIFQSILSVSTTFVAPSVPVNVFNRSQTENELFLALFKADENALPFWPGNLKKLNIAPVTLPDGTESFELQDANGLAAIDTDGRIKATAVTPWTNTADANLLTAIDGESTVGTDGRAIERGGAGQKIPGYLTSTPSTTNGDAAGRIVYAEDGTNLVDFNWSPVTTAAFWTELSRDMPPTPTPADAFPATQPVAFGADPEKAQVNRVARAIAYTRGFQHDANFAITGIRSWMMGDPLHSRPLTVNYGERGAYNDGDPDTENPDIRILFGTNDGIFHMVRNTDTSGGDNTAGDETWAFVPREVMPLLDTLAGGLAQTDPVHPILVDGAATAFVFDANDDTDIESTDGDFAYVVFGLRRGGMSYYALDITDPDNPSFLWRIGKYANPVGAGLPDGDPDQDLSLMTGFEEMAQTFSIASRGFINLGSGNIPVFVFAGGYNGDSAGDNLDDDDATANFGDGTGLGKDQANRDGANNVTISVGEDDESDSPSRFEGNAIYIVNAATGALIWKASGNSSGGANSKHVAGMLDSIPMEPAAVDTIGDGLLDRIYFGDTGGRVWRADIPSSLSSDNRTNWKVTLLLDAGRHQENDRPNDRRFFNRPDVVQSSDSVGAFDAVLIGSGDREYPTGDDTEDAFFMIKDRNITQGSGTNSGFTYDNSSSSLADLTNNCLQTGTEASCSLDLTNGWFLELGLGTANSGEKNLSPALTLGGTVFFTTFSPSTSTCGLSEGSGKQFAVNLLDATAVFNYDTSNDGSASYPEDRFDEIESGGIPVEPVTLGKDILLFQGQAGEETIQNTGAATSWTTYWYEEDV